MSQLIIDEELKALIPAHSPDELDALTKSVLGYGILDSLKVWRREDGDVLLDGFTRHAISQKYGCEFDVKPVEVGNREEAEAWIIKHQLGRRNLSAEQQSILRGKLYNAAKKPHGGQVPKGIAQSEPSLPTAEKLAEEHGVSPATIKRDGVLATAVDKLKEADPEIESKVASGEVLKYQAITAASQETVEAQREVLAQKPARQQAAKEFDLEKVLAAEGKRLDQIRDQCSRPEQSVFDKWIKKYASQSR